MVFIKDEGATTRAWDFGKNLPHNVGAMFNKEKKHERVKSRKIQVITYHDFFRYSTLNYACVSFRGALPLLRRPQPISLFQPVDRKDTRLQRVYGIVFRDGRIVPVWRVWVVAWKPLRILRILWLHCTRSERDDHTQAVQCTLLREPGSKLTAAQLRSRTVIDSI